MAMSIHYSKSPGRLLVVLKLCSVVARISCYAWQGALTYAYSVQCVQADWTLLKSYRLFVEYLPAEGTRP